MIDGYIQFLGFRSQDNYSPRKRKGMGLSSAWLTLQLSPSNSNFCKIWKRADIISWLIEWVLSDRPYSSVRDKVECCKSRDHFGCRVTDCSATRIPYSSITGRHPRLTGRLIGKSLTPLQRCSWRILLAQPTRRRIESEERRKSGVSGKRVREEEDVNGKWESGRGKRHERKKTER